MNSISERTGASSIFWPLTRHEIRLKGSWRKHRSQLPLKWWITYLSILVLAVFAAVMFVASRYQIDLGGLWYATIGYPYWVFFIGLSMIKREWENDSFGWWLTLPYSRTKLIGAKWAAAVIRTVFITAVVFAVGTLFCSLLASLPGYTFADVGKFCTQGIVWCAIIIGFSPFLIAIGLFTASIQRTSWRPFAPIVWILVMGVGSLLYWTSQNHEMVMSGAILLSNALLIQILVSWVLALGFVQLTAWLLDKQLSI
jgi:ABC-2 type transport system permease protein